MGTDSKLRVSTQKRLDADTCDALAQLGSSVAPAYAEMRDIHTNPSKESEVSKVVATVKWSESSECGDEVRLKIWGIN